MTTAAKDITREAAQQLASALGESLGKRKTKAQQADLLHFYDHHLPKLKAGSYKIEVVQKLTIPEKGVEEKTNSFIQPFLISGPRFGLKKDDIQSVYPPAGVTGEFHNNLAQISFHRPTLPWELEANGKKDSPWLCLVLFKAEEAPKVNKIEIIEFIGEAPHILDPKKEVDVIQVRKDLIPEQRELLAHTRKSSEEGATEKAFLLGHRLPEEEGDYVVHLISLKDKSDDRYISLYNWSFTSKKEDVSFSATMAKNSVDVFRLPVVDEYKALAQKGYVPLPYFMRSGHTALALYRSALIPKGIQNQPNDRLKKLKSGERTFLNRSHEAAFQLGQLLTVANKEMATAIFGWKREMVQQFKSKQSPKSKVSFNLDQSGLVEDKLTQSRVRALPETAKNWLVSLLLLEPVPFNYLIPYEAMLPEPGIRFFELNSQWLRSLLEGALSTAEEVFEFDGIETLIPQKTTGFILRNPVVGHYAELLVNTKTTHGNQAELLFKHKLGDDILLCCYEGEVKEFEITLPGQALYPGFDQEQQRKVLPEVLDKDNRCIDMAKLKTKLGAEGSGQLGARLMTKVNAVKYEVK